MDEPSLSRLLQHARRLIAASSPDEVLSHTCREALALTGAGVAYGSYAAPGQPWERGHHVRVAGDLQQVPAAARSALFAVHRRLAGRRGPVTLERGGEPEAIFSALAGAPAGAARILHAVPIIHRSGRVVGEITVVLDDPDPIAGVAGTLAELTRLACAALENAGRLAACRRDQEKLLLFAEASEEALWDWDIGPDEVWWGGGIQNLLGSGSVTIQNKLAWKLGRIRDDEVARVHDSLRRALAAPVSSWREEYPFRRADGSWILVEDRAYFLREADGRAYRVIGTMRDVTTLRELLAREQQARTEAETASRAKDEFLAMLGHELRNPLAPIMTALHLTRLRGVDAIDRELTVIERQAQHLVRLVDDLLDVSRVTRGKIELRREEVEISAVIAKAIEMASPAIEERRHQLEIRVARRGLAVDADPSRLAQVVTNLLTNAARYTEPGGQIRIAARRVDGSIEIVVADSGRGIAPEMLPRVFEMFTQERQELDRAHGGLGLGLAIVRSLVGLHGGEVRARSDGRGRGSEFTVRLPARAASDELGAVAPVGATEVPAAREQNGRRILVVDDNQDAADLLAAWLEQLGIRTRIAYDGPEALRIAEEFTPDLVFLDLGLPVMDGYEVARRLREQLRCERCRLVAVTGYGTEADRRLTEEARFDDHLVKPVSMEHLHRVLDQLLE